jgi:hypothetical protein
MTRGEAPRCFTIHYEHTGFLRVATSGKTRARILEELNAIDACGWIAQPPSQSESGFINQKARPPAAGAFLPFPYKRCVLESIFALFCPQTPSFGVDFRPRLRL